jgi:hypothetical protein
MAHPLLSDYLLFKLEICKSCVLVNIHVWSHIWNRVAQAASCHEHKKAADIAAHPQHEELSMQKKGAP